MFSPVGLHLPVVPAALPVVTGIKVNAPKAQKHRRVSIGSTNRVSPHLGQHSSLGVTLVRIKAATSITVTVTPTGG